MRARLLTPPEAGETTLVYVHGGGWYLGDLDGCEPVARVLAQATRCAILAVEHRQAPEHPFPAGLDDVRAALAWATAELPPAGAIGDSSGANLIAAAAHTVGGLAAQVLVYPVVDLATDPEPRPDPDGLPPVDLRAMAATRERYLAGADPADPDASPLLAPDLTGLPPTLVCVAEYDLLRPQGLRYAERLREAGVDTTVLDAAGLDHAFLSWGSFARRPAQAIAELGEAVRSMLAAAP
jgi:acetyl esterase